MSYLFISHDLTIVRYMADRVAVMRNGRIVETGSPREIWTSPAHPYTRSLIDAVPEYGRARSAAPVADAHRRSFFPIRDAGALAQ